MKDYKPLNGRKVLAARIYNAQIASKDKSSPNGTIVIRIPLIHGGVVTGHIVSVSSGSLIGKRPYSKYVKKYMLKSVNDLLDKGVSFKIIFPKEDIAIEWRFQQTTLAV